MHCNAAQQHKALQLLLIVLEIKNEYITELFFGCDSSHAVFITSHFFGIEIIAVVLKAEECSAVRGCGL